MSRHEELIKKILNEDEKSAEDPINTLRAHSFDHLSDDYLPKTMTPYEWLEYYEQHGVPESHKQQVEPTAKPAKRPWWQRLFIRSCCAKS